MLIANFRKLNNFFSFYRYNVTRYNISMDFSYFTFLNTYKAESSLALNIFNKIKKTEQNNFILNVQSTFKSTNSLNTNYNEND